MIISDLVFIIVVGCGRVGAELSFRLYKRGHQVAVIDQVGKSFGHLPPEYRGRTIEGEVLNQDVLSRAGIKQAQGLAAVTNSDSVNAVVGPLARTVYHVPNVIVRNYDPRWLPMHEGFGLQVVSSTAWGAQRIEEMLYQPVGRSVFSAGNGEVEIYELVVPSSWHGRTLPEVLPAEDCLPVAVTRAGRSALPPSDWQLEPGDVLHVSATLGAMEALRERISRGL